MGRSLHCYAWGNDDGWEALCTDLDLAVQADTIDDVRRLLNESIRAYVAMVKQESPDDRSRLLRRRSPWSLRLWLWVSFNMHRLLGGGIGDGHHRGGRHVDRFHCPA